ncbi:diguanylate cyclase [Devosia enhydra]|uniref:diguanylate cyclase n=1 Tax=Devosia enhydra TaxID=665118 RepID=A0A1K2I304_9HYPH|nr:diguanylate cyclase [Devosia enhydra]SFZ86603.1 diguanylate cyclase [Devosia enhydra]
MIAALGRFYPQGLRTRMLVLTLLAFVAVGVPAYISFTWIVQSTIERLGTLFAEKQVLFDRYRGMGALLQEVTLAETLARAPIILDWARNEADPERRARGLAELEHYRLAFADKSYFFVVAGSGNYYFNDAQNAYAGDQLRYTLSPDNPRDGWFYSTMALGDGCHLNVDHDDVLRVTKVWFNCVVRDGDEVLGVLGSGLDLTSFIREVVDIPQTGVEAMFVDRNGALQAHRDERLVDFHSLTKQIGARKTIFALLDRPQDEVALRAMLEDVTTSDVEVESRMMRIGGHDVLVGVGYLDRLGWYNITFMDVDKIIDRRLFVPIGLLLAAVVLAASLTVAFVFKRIVLDRLKLVEARVAAIKAGNFAHADSTHADPASDEIGRLSRAFAEMAHEVGGNTQMLEREVRRRTEALEALAFVDQLTGIANRRGFSDRFAAVSAERKGAAQLALLLIDVDHFKRINDSFGHAAGDAVVVAVAQRLKDVARSRDGVGRWGGDEFIVLIHDIGAQSLKAIADAVQRAITSAAIDLPGGQTAQITVSVGAYLVVPDESLEAAADRADTALYRAKAEGRNRVVIYDPQRHGGSPMRLTA